MSSVRVALTSLLMMLHSIMIIELKRISIRLLAIHLRPGNFVSPGSLVSHSFELESKVKTAYYGAPALITYRIPTKSKLQRFLAKYGSHISVFVAIILFANILTSPSKASAGKKRH